MTDKMRSAIEVLLHHCEAQTPRLTLAHVLLDIDVDRFAFHLDISPKDLATMLRAPARLVVALSLMSMLLGACSASSPPQAEDYNQSCQTSDDCVLVRLADACGCSGVGAINASDQTLLDADNEAEEDRFDQCEQAAGCLALPPHEAVCDMGMCAAYQSPPDPSSEQFDQSCEADVDCVVVTVESLCGGCSTFEALNVDDEGYFDAEVEQFLTLEKPAFCAGFGACEAPKPVRAFCDASTNTCVTAELEETSEDT